jgi:Tfp pilus assembly protein PilO
MISFKDPRDQLGSSLFVGGIVLLSASLVMFLFVHPPTTKGIQGKKLAKLRQASNAIDTANERIDVIKQVFEKTKWKEKPDLITGNVLSIVRAATAKASVKLISFRPQRTVETTDLLQLPYVLAVDGSFPNVVKFVQSIEESDSKLAVSSFQLASAEGTSDFVTASVGLVAYRDPYTPGATVSKNSEATTGNKPATGDAISGDAKSKATAASDDKSNAPKETKEESNSVGKLETTKEETAPKVKSTKTSPSKL